MKIKEEGEGCEGEDKVSDIERGVKKRK